MRGEVTGDRQQADGASTCRLSPVAFLPDTLSYTALHNIGT